MTEKNQKIVAIAAISAVVLLMIAVSIVVAVPMIRLAENPAAFKAWVEGFGAWGRVIFVGLLVLQVIVALIPGGPFELAAGYAYGVAEGSILCMIAFLLGSAGIFFLVRKFGMKVVELFVSQKDIKQLEFLKNPRKTRTLAFILMIIPGSPKDALNYIAGLTNLKLQEWLLIVFIGRIPALVSTVISGAAAGEKNFVLSLAVLLLTAVVSGLGVLYYRNICRQEQVDEMKKATTCEVTPKS